MLTELRRRNVLRVAAAYVAVSWLLIQVIETLFPVFGLPGTAIRAVEQAVDCIRTGLETPTWVMPFLEPHLPFYDEIRGEPAFVELVEELE